MAIQDVSDRVGDGFVGVVALYQYSTGVDNLTLFKTSAVLQQLGYIGVHGGGVSPGDRGAHLMAGRSPAGP